MQWEMLQRQEQQMYLILMQNCQEHVVLTIGGMKELNLNAALQVLYHRFFYSRRIEIRLRIFSSCTFFCLLSAQ